MSEKDSLSKSAEGTDQKGNTTENLNHKIGREYCKERIGFWKTWRKTRQNWLLGENLKWLKGRWILVKIFRIDNCDHCLFQISDDAFGIFIVLAKIINIIHCRLLNMILWENVIIRGHDLNGPSLTNLDTQGSHLDIQINYRNTITTSDAPCDGML